VVEEVVDRLVMVQQAVDAEALVVVVMEAFQLPLV
jgi:hypothetical protein